MATSPLPSGGPTSGRKCYITPAFSGVPIKGDKIRNDYLAPTLGAFSHSARTTPVITVFTLVTARTAPSIISFQPSELTELSPPFKVFTVAASCLLASRDRCVVLGARGFARGGGVADFDGLLPRSSGGGEGLRE